MSGDGNIIDQAADRLRGRWCKGEWIADDGAVCLSGAVNQTAEFNDRFAIKEHIARTIQREHPRYADLETQPGLLLMFNDAKDTTEEDVLLVLKHAAVDYDEIHGGVA